MNEINQIKKLMESMTEGYYDNNTYDNDSGSGMMDTTRMMFELNEPTITVLNQVNHQLKAYKLRIDVVEEEGYLYADIKRIK